MGKLHVVMQLGFRDTPFEVDGLQTFWRQTMWTTLSSIVTYVKTSLLSQADNSTVGQFTFWISPFAQQKH